MHQKTDILLQHHRFRAPDKDLYNHVTFSSSDDTLTCDCFLGLSTEVLDLEFPLLQLATPFLFSEFSFC